MALKIMLACAGGFSTSMLVERMLAAVEAQDIDVEIVATAEGKIDKLVNQLDVLLLGPQVSYLEAALKSKYQDKELVIGEIASIDYGMMNGEKVLADSLALYHKGHGGVNNG